MWRPAASVVQPESKHVSALDVARSTWVAVSRPGHIGPPNVARTFETLDGDALKPGRIPLVCVHGLGLADCAEKVFVRLIELFDRRWQPLLFRFPTCDTKRGILAAARRFAHGLHQLGRTMKTRHIAVAGYSIGGVVCLEGLRYLAARNIWLPSENEARDGFHYFDSIKVATIASPIAGNQVANALGWLPWRSIRESKRGGIVPFDIPSQVEVGRFSTGLLPWTGDGMIRRRDLRAPAPVRLACDEHISGCISHLGAIKDPRVLSRVRHFLRKA